METSIYILEKSELPAWFTYPDSFLKIVDQSLVDLSPWHILSDELLKAKLKGFKERYPSLSLIPFARRFDNDDVACWEKENPDQVLIIHDYASEGWERRQSYDNFWTWFKAAIDDMINFD